MARKLVLEQLGPLGWVEVGELDEHDPPGSISNRASGNREVIRFRWAGTVAIVDRSLAGADVLEGEGTVRRIITEGFERLATLHAGQDFVLPVMTDEMTEVRETRFRHVGR